MTSYIYRMLCSLLSLCLISQIAVSVEAFACEAVEGQGVGLMSTVPRLNTCRTPSCGYDEYYLIDMARSGITTELYSSYTSTYYQNALNDYYGYDNIWDHYTQAAAVDVHNYAANTYDFLLSTFGRTFNQITGQKMISWVDNPNRTNAVWNGWGTEYGVPTESGYYRPSRAIDFVGHEFAHGVTNYAVRYNGIQPRPEACLIVDYYGESGALQESFSDWIGIAVKLANRSTADWMLGRDAYTGELSVDGRKIFGRRNVANPREEINVRCLQPDYYGGVNWCQTCPPNPCDFVHVNNGVSNKMFYLLSEPGTHTHSVSGVNVQGLGMTKALQIAYNANMNYWPRNASFYQAMLGMIEAAAYLNADSCGVPNYYANDVLQVKLAWTAVGVGNRLPVAKLGDGNGTVSSRSTYLPAGYSMDVYPPGDIVTLTATPDANSVFNAWYREECGSIYLGSGQTIDIEPSGLLVYAEFVRPKIYVSKTGTGSGTVSGPGIWCGSDCSEIYLPNTNVMLTASADYGSLFTGWSGGGCGGNGSCTVPMNGIQYVTAIFDYDYSGG